MKLLFTFKLGEKQNELDDDQNLLIIFPNLLDIILLTVKHISFVIRFH